MDAKSTAKGCARGLAWFLAGLAVIFAYLTLTSLVQRVQFGSGLMFADVEIFAALTALLAVVGGGLLWMTRPPKENCDEPGDTQP